MKKRKEGGMALIGGLLALIVALSMLGFFYLNVMVVYETLNRSVNAVEEGARVRAQAVDIPLKETYGFVESFHRYKYQIHDNLMDGGGETINEFIDVSRNQFETQPGHTFLANDFEYDESFNYANKVTKEAIIDYIYDRVGNNAHTGGENEQRMISLEPDNICIDVQPIPRELGRSPDTRDRVEFSCDLVMPDGTPNAGQIKTVYHVLDRVPVETNERYVTVVKYDMDQDGTPDMEREYRVKNVVFVAAAVRYDPFIINLLENEDNQYEVNQAKIVKATAFPHVDECTTGFEFGCGAE